MICLAWREPTESGSTEIPPSPFGGPGGLSGERPPVQEMSDAELDEWAVVSYNRSMALFEAMVAVARRPRRRRKFRDYQAKNCEEAYPG